MKRVKNNLTRFRCEGLNIVRLINLCTSSGIKLQNIDRQESRVIEFELNDNDLIIFKKLNLSDYDITIKKLGGIDNIKKRLIMRVGLIIGAILSIVFFIVMQNRLLNISIDGLENVDYRDVVSAIDEFGIKKYCKINFNDSTLEDFLTEKFDFVLVSTKVIGNTLIINVKEKNDDINKQYVAITSNYNMIITKIDVYSGTSNKKVGDIVYAGDILVEPFEYINEEKIDVVPCAEITGDVYFSERYEFYNTEEKIVRTGKTQIVKSETYLGKIKIFSSSIDPKFENLEIENTETYISDYFLPINIIKSTAFELTTISQEHNFEEEKESIISNLKNSVYSKVPEHLNVENEEIKISSTNFGNIITIYLKSSVYLNYTND